MSVASLPNCEMYYELHGEGTPALVFVHGGYCTHDDFHAQVDALKDRYTVVTLDLRAHGQSSGTPGEWSAEDAARDVEDLVDELGIGPVVLIGHSLGTRVVLQAAADRPDSTLGVVLLDGSRMRSTDVPADAPIPPDDMVKEFFLSTFSGLLPDELVHVDPLVPEIKSRLVDKISETPANEIVAFSNAVNRWDIASFDRVLDQLGATSVPVLAMQSTYVDDESAIRSLEPGTETTPYLDSLAEHIPALQVELLHDTGHFLMIEKPEFVSNAIDRFASDAQASKAG